MAVVAYVYTALQVRLAELRQEGERGDSPVPTAVIIAGLAVLAATITAIATKAAEGWMDKIPTP